MRSNWWLTVSALCFFIALAIPQQTPNDVAFGGEHFFKFRVSAGGLSPEERAIALQLRLTQVFTKLLAQGAPLSIRVNSLKTMKSISVAGVPFVTVTPADAEANQMTVEQLARVWADNLYWGLGRILSKVR